MSWVETLMKWLGKVLHWSDTASTDHETTITLVPTPVDPVPEAPEAPTANVDTPKYDWGTPTSSRLAVRQICDEEGLTVDQKDDMSKIIHCESGYNVKTVHPNLDKNGNVSTTDYSICQINDYWHIGAGKDFPSVDYVMHNPEAVVRWMCGMIKAGKRNLWVCASSGLCERYTP